MLGVHAAMLFLNTTLPGLCDFLVVENAMEQFLPNSTHKQKPLALRDECSDNSHACCELLKEMPQHVPTLPNACASMLQMLAGFQADT